MTLYISHSMWPICKDLYVQQDRGKGLQKMQQPFLFNSWQKKKKIIFKNVFSRFQEPKEHHDDRTETMLKIYEDSTLAKEMQNRY